jgi:hypothetical protein
MPVPTGMFHQRSVVDRFHTTGTHIAVICLDRQSVVLYMFNTLSVGNCRDSAGL